MKIVEIKQSDLQDIEKTRCIAEEELIASLLDENDLVRIVPDGNLPGCICEYRKSADGTIERRIPGQR